MIGRTYSLIGSPEGSPRRAQQSAATASATCGPGHRLLRHRLCTLHGHRRFTKVLHCLLKGLRWLSGAGERQSVTGKRGIWQARTRLVRSARCAELYGADDTTNNDAATEGALDLGCHSWSGSTASCLDVADTEGALPRRPKARRGRAPSRGFALCPRLERRARVFQRTVSAAPRTARQTLAHAALPALYPAGVLLATEQLLGHVAAGRRPPRRRRPCLAGEREISLHARQYSSTTPALTTIYPQREGSTRRGEGVQVRIVGSRGSKDEPAPSRLPGS